jgi:hypothetical protein
MNQAKDLKRTLLKRNLKRYLNKNYDWKVTRAISTGEPLTDKEKIFRQNIVDDYNKRLQALEEVRTLEQLDQIKLGF